MKFVRSSIKMGIDIWQGCFSTNNVPELVKQFGVTLSFMDGIDNGVVDRENCSMDAVDQDVRRACETNWKLHFIPNATIGGPVSKFPGVYDAVTEENEKTTKEMF